MRIISGLYRGKKLNKPKDLTTRPLKDLTKESIFNIIEHSNKININLSTSYILDVFSGIGSFGIECLSRGVKKVTFVENYTNVLPILKRNLSELKTILNYEIIEKNAYKKDIFFKFKNKIDIIFLDPPYKDKNLFDLLRRIENSGVLKKEGIIILHRHKNEKDIFPPKFNIIEEKKYGISKIIFLNF